MPPPNVTNCSDTMPLLKQFFLPAAYGLLFAVGLVGNLTAIGVYVTMLRPWKSSGVIMVNLAVSDLLHMLTLPFLVDYYTRGEAWNTGRLTCYLVRVAFHFHLYCSVLLLTCLAAFRWLVVARPLCAAQVQRRGWGLAACAAAWAAAIAGVGPMPSVLSGVEVVDGGNRTTCKDFASQTSLFYSWVLTVFGFLLPLAMVAACYAGIAWELAKGPYTAGPRRARARRLPLAILAGFVVCFLPYHVLRALRVETLRPSGGWSCEASEGVHAAYVVSRPLTAVSTLFNLGLNTLAGGRFQRAIGRAVGRIFGAGRQGTGANIRKTRVVNVAVVRRPSWAPNEAGREATNANDPGVDVDKKPRM